MDGTDEGVGVNEGIMLGMEVGGMVDITVIVICVGVAASQAANSTAMMNIISKLEIRFEVFIAHPI